MADPADKLADLIRRLRAYVEAEQYMSAEGLCEEAADALEALAPADEPEWLTGCPECGADSGCDCPSGTVKAAPAAHAPLTLDAFDEHDLCDAWAGLPVEFFSPGPSFGIGKGGAA